MLTLMIVNVESAEGVFKPGIHKIIYDMECGVNHINTIKLWSYEVLKGKNWSKLCLLGKLPES